MLIMVLNFNLQINKIELENTNKLYTVTLNSTDGRDCQIRKKRASSTSAASNPYVMPFPSGQWLENPDIYYLRNQKQGYNLIFQGFMYKKEASFRSTINWICSNGNGRRVSDNKCAARCITNWEGALKLGKHSHNHEPRFTPETMPAKALTKAEFKLTS